MMSRVFWRRSAIVLAIFIITMVVVFVVTIPPAPFAESRTLGPRPLFTTVLYDVWGRGYEYWDDYESIDPHERGVVYFDHELKLLVLVLETRALERAHQFSSTAETATWATRDCQHSLGLNDVNTFVILDLKRCIAESVVLAPWEVEGFWSAFDTNAPLPSTPLPRPMLDLLAEDP